MAMKAGDNFKLSFKVVLGGFRTTQTSFLVLSETLLLVYLV